MKIPLWETLALQLAGAAGINTAKFRLENVAGKPALILRRFDREGERRIPYLSAMSMLDANDGELRSYMELGGTVPGRPGTAPSCGGASCSAF